MRIYPEKGHSLTEAERLELGRLLLKMGLHVRLGKEKVGSAARWFIEFYYMVGFGHEKTAPSDESTERGGAEENNSTDNISSEWGRCQ